jgi:hypothetical protein
MYMSTLRFLLKSKPDPLQTRTVSDLSYLFRVIIGCIVTTSVSPTQIPSE